MDIAAPPSLSRFSGDDGPSSETTGSGLGTVAFLSTMPPLRCGLATFTADLREAVGGAEPGTRCLPVAVGGSGPGLSLERCDPAAYRAMGDTLNRAGVDLLCLQHEFGIFGGPDGEMVLELLERFAGPVVVTMHTVLDRPSPNQRRIVEALVRRAARVVVMTRHSARLMRETYATPAERLRVVPHGIPLPPRGEREADRGREGDRWAAGDRPGLLTFGLLSPGKGIEHAIRALPAVTARHPDVLYTVLGSTHPNLLREEGERHREQLEALAASLGVTDNIRFLNRFVTLDELTEAIRRADIYLTPYVNEAQSVSGTLAYSYGLGTAVVSTPYRHAAELLADGRGALVPFADPGAIAEAVNALLDDPARLRRMRDAARLAGRAMVWPQVGRDYLAIFREAMAGPARPGPA